MPHNLNVFLTIQLCRSQACDPGALSNRDMYITCSFLLFVRLFVFLFVLLFVLVQHISPVLIEPKGLVIIYRRGGAQDLELNKVNISRSPL